MKTKLLTLAGISAFAVSAIALSSFSKIFQDTYQVSADATLGKAKCKVCHVGSTNKLNLYGADVKKALAGTKKLTAEVLKKTESLDSDKDGATNCDEIKADKLPGDPNSKPGN
ncbi:MAG: hypothetical protein U0R49_06180 [Fimbriimonadales bacterium]